VGGKIVTMTKKSMSELIKCEGVVLFFDGKGVILHEFVPCGQTVNGQFYLEVMKRLREATRRKRPEEWRNKTWMLHRDNAPAHTLLLIHEFLVKHEMSVIPQLPYSLDLIPAEFFLFPKLNSTLKGRRFQMIEELDENSLWDLRAIPQNAFQAAFKNWKKRKRCMDRGGEYFEKDK
jgi:hypothetical protein